MNQPRIAEEILSVLESYPEGKTSQQLSQILGYHSGKQFAKLVKMIAHLEEDKQIKINDNGVIQLAIEETVVEGTFSQNDKGFGFVRRDNENHDIFIPRGKTNSALNGDVVKVKITKPEVPWADKSAEGIIIDVVERQVTRLTGEFTAFDDKLKKETGYYGGLKPQNKGFDNLTCFISEDGLHPVTGEIVVAEISQYPTEDKPQQVIANVVQQIGHKDEPGVDILAILNMFDIPHEFPQEVKEAVDRVPETISDDDMSSREDLRQLLTITIDGDDAKDLDDAISLTELPSGNMELGVHIADVSHYVTEGSPLDKEAYERGTSVYLTDRVVPMLPQRLSNGICSLHPNVDRLTLSCLMEVTRDGQVINHQIKPTVINSDYRMTYHDVNAMLENNDEQLIAKYQDIYPMLQKMEKLHHTLYHLREARGAINFDTNEAEIEVDEQGKPVAIHVRERGVGERMIESFMLLANETVARHYTEELVPFIYRVHEHPDTDRLQRFLEFITTFGIVAKGTKDEMKPKYLQQILQTVEDETYAPVVKMMLLRSMQQAKYDVTPIGHYGLAATDYTHFTSPIRLYPDLIVHRLIYYYSNHQLSKKQEAKQTTKLSEIADHSSEMERRSVDAERETDSLKKTEYMQDKIGMIFDGYVSSITGFGMFVELDNTVEGLVHISTIKDDYYNYVERQLVLIGERTGNTFHIGDSVKVRLVKADVDTREIDFELVQDDTKTKKRHKKSPRKAQQKNNQRKRGKNKKGQRKYQSNYRRQKGHGKKNRKRKHKK